MYSRIVNIDTGAEVVLEDEGAAKEPERKKEQNLQNQSPHFSSWQPRAGWALKVRHHVSRGCREASCSAHQQGYFHVPTSQVCSLQCKRFLQTHRLIEWWFALNLQHFPKAVAALWKGSHFSGSNAQIICTQIILSHTQGILATSAHVHLSTHPSLFAWSCKHALHSLFLGIRIYLAVLK